MFFILMNIIAVFYFLSLAKRKQKLFGIIPFLASVALVVMLIQAIRSGHFWLYQGPVSIAEMGFCILMLTSTLLISISIKWKERSITDKIFTSSALLLFGILGFGLLASRIDGTAGKTPGDWWILMFFVAIAVAPASLTAGELKFGKVNVVLTQSLFYLGLSILVLLLYSLIHEVFFYFGLSFRYQVLAEISVLVAIVILLRNIYNAFEDRVKKFFTLSQQKRLDELNRFVSSIPRYTSSEKLLEDLENKLTGFFKASYVIAGTKVSGGPGTDELNALGKALIHPEDFWSKNKQLSANLLPEPYESGLQKSPLALAFPLRTKDQDGFLLLGRKKRGVYNLSDLELMGRILQQTRLTLEVLALVEREKLLLEKNYEANLTALRSQINPHFLFNTLNTISSLIHDAPTDAENAIEKLAYIFRYTMRTSGSKFVQLEDEMSLVKTYLEIEKFRFGNRIELHFDFDQDVLDTSIPGLVIQTVVENCIKHGVAKIMGVGTISIIISKNGNNAQVVVEDNGPGIDISRIHSSTGLNNILTRMKEIYRKENLIYFENTGKGTRVTIQIPLNHE